MGRCLWPAGLYTAHQAFTAAALGAEYAAPYLGRMNDSGKQVRPSPPPPRAPHSHVAHVPLPTATWWPRASMKEKSSECDFVRVVFQFPKP